MPQHGDGNTVNPLIDQMRTNYSQQIQQLQTMLGEATLTTEQKSSILTQMNTLLQNLNDQTTAIMNQMNH